MDSRTGKIYDDESLAELKKRNPEAHKDLEQHLVPITSDAAKALAEESLKERLSWLQNFHRENELAKERK